MLVFSTRMISCLGNVLKCIITGMLLHHGMDMLEPPEIETISSDKMQLKLELKLLSKRHVRILTVFHFAEHHQ